MKEKGLFMTKKNLRMVSREAKGLKNIKPKRKVPV